MALFSLRNSSQLYDTDSYVVKLERNLMILEGGNRL